LAALVNYAWAQPYVGLSIGSANYKDSCAGTAFSCGGSDTAFRILGGYQLTPYVALEAGFSELGTVGASNGDHADLSAIDVSAVGTWRIANRFALLGRLGGYWGNSDVTIGPTPAVPAVFPPPPPPPTSGWQSGHSTNITYGFGASYDLTHSATFRLEWQRFKGLGNVPKIDIDVYALSALFHF
jgi:OOP family OmpA-OmpF porin